MNIKCIVVTMAAVLCFLPLAAQNDTGLIRVSANAEPVDTGRFEPTWESLGKQEVPQWFRNAKFGIWAHWGPQCVEGTGDWMARAMYREGSKEYNYHVEHYGHPTEIGFKDVIPHFKAEKWNPEELVAYYKKIGARYFVALANHHDNFDLWDSKYQPWNSVNMGPKRDVLAEWEAAARKEGLPFGISIHADHAWTWYETAQRYDLKGEKRGKMYDGNMTAADGKGKWWEGYDPQDLYAQIHPLSEGGWNASTEKIWAWGNGAARPSQKFIDNVYNRTIDAINRYNPDLIYFDVTVLPFWPISDAGLKIAAHFYNHNLNISGGKGNGVLTGKLLDEQQRKAVTWDVERGIPDDIIPYPWQTCTCIGGWHYKTEIYEKGKYKTAKQVIRMLVDVVSKNGNMLLSVPLRADGTFDEKEASVLDGIGNWMAVNSESIYDTRPCAVFGETTMKEGTGTLKGGQVSDFNEKRYAEMTSQEIRFTQTCSDLYVSILSIPEGETSVTIKSLCEGSKVLPSEIRKIRLLGHGNVKFERSAGGLTVFLPENAGDMVVPVLKIKK